MTLAVIGAVIGEFVGSDNRGLGYFIYSESAAANTARAFASVVILAALGIVLFGLAAVVERAVLPWRRVAGASHEP